MLERLRWKLGLEPGAPHRLRQTIKANTDAGITHVETINDGPDGTADLVLNQPLDLSTLATVVDEYEPFLDHKDEEQLTAEHDDDQLTVYRTVDGDSQRVLTFDETRTVRIDQVPMNKTDPLSLQLDLVTAYLNAKTS